MKLYLLLFSMLFFINLNNYAQIAIGAGTPTPAASAMLDVQSTNSGVLIPRLTTAQRTAIVSPATSLMVYQTDGTAGFYYFDGSIWQLLATGSGGTGYIQNQVTADQAAGFRVTGNGLFNGGQVAIGTITPVASALFTLNPTTNIIRSGIDMAFPGSGTITSTAYGINMNVTSNANINGLLYNNTSNALSSFYGTGAVLSNTNIVSGYQAYRNSSGLSYGLYGINGSSATYATNVSTWAAFLQGRTVISSESSPSSLLGTDLEVRNTTAGAAAPATISMRQSTSLITAGNVMANLNFGDNYVTTPQAQIQVTREATSGSASDLPTAFVFSTTTDGASAMAERLRISNNGNVAINQPTPDVSAILDINSSSKGVRFPQVALTAANTAGPVTTPATGLIVYNTATAGVVPNDVVPGYYYNSGTSGSPLWKRLATSSSTGDAWVITGNNNITTTTAPATYGSSTFTGQNFIGTSTSTDVIFGSSNIERMRLQSGGALTIGATVNGAKLDVHQTSGTAVGRFTNYGNSTLLELRRSGGTQAAPTATTAAGTILGRIFGQGYDGANYTSAASITIETDAAGGTATDMPGRITFATTLDGTASSVERMRIDNIGKVGINLTPSMRLDVTDASTTVDDATIRGVATGAARVYGILGTTNSTTANASGVRGFASGTTGTNNGVWGESASSSGSGVYGLATNIDGDGVYGFNNAAASFGYGSGVLGITRQYGDAVYPTGGVYGSDLSNNTLGNGVVGTTTLGNGVSGFASGDGSWGVYGQNYSTGTGFAQIGILGEKTGATGTGTGYGVWGSASGSGTVNIGGYFVATTATNSIALRLGASTSGFVNISPSATTTSYTITLPPAVAATAGSVLTSSTTGITAWTSVASLGTGAFVDLTTAQTAAGAKTWSNLGTFNAGITVAGGAVLLNDNAGTNQVAIGTGTTTGTVNIGGIGAQTINVGAAAAAKTVNIGSSNTTSTTTILSGSGGIQINSSNNQPTNVASGTSTGTVTIGGNGTQTVSIANNAAGVKTVNIGNSVAGSNVNINAGTGTAVNITGDLNLTTAGNKIKITTGANASIGTATLVGGTVTVNTTAVATGSIIMININTPSGTPGLISAPAASIVNGTSFVINSSSVADTSTINWWIIN